MGDKQTTGGGRLLRGGATRALLMSSVVSFFVAVSAMLTATPAKAADCSYGGCVADLARMPPTQFVDVADILRRAQRFFRADAKAYIVNSEERGARLPYYLRQNPPWVRRGQIHIPEIYYFGTELKNEGQRHYVWHYIIGHEMAHAYQDNLRLVEAMIAGYVNQSVVLVELHADFLAGFFMAREFGISSVAIDNLLREVRDLPTGPPGSQSFHGRPGQRFFMATQGALMGFQQPVPTLEEASSRGVRCAFDILDAGRSGAGAQPLSELCK